MSVAKTVKRIANTIPTWGVWWERFETAKKIVKPAELTLDLGCSEYGGMEKFLTREGGKVIGADLKKNIDRNLLNEKFFYVVADAQYLPFKNSSFPQTLCLDMIEHISNDIKAAEEIERISKSGANIVLSTPSEQWRFPYFGFMRLFCKPEEQILKEFGHKKKGYSEEQLKELFSGCNISEKKYFVSGLSALGYDIEFSRLRILENLILKVLFPALWINFKLLNHKNGTHIAVRMRKN